MKQLGFKLLRYGQNSYPDGSAAEIAVLERSEDLSVPFLSHNMIVGINGSSIPALSIRFSRDGLVGLKLPKDRSLFLAYYATTPGFEGQNKEQLRVNDALKGDIEELLKEKRPRENADWVLNLPSHDIHLPEPYSKELRMRKKTYLLLNECARIIEGLVKEVGLITVRQLYYRLVVESSSQTCRKHMTTSTITSSGAGSWA